MPMQQALPAASVDQRRAERGDRLAQLAAALAALLDEPRALDLGEHGAGDGRAQGVAAERRAVRAGEEQVAGARRR